MSKPRKNNGSDALIRKAATLANRINAMRKEYGHLMTRAGAVAKNIGELLLEARELMGSMKLSRWALAECDMTRDCVHRYMTIASNWNKIEKRDDFARLNVTQMFDVARDKPPRTRSEKLYGKSLDSLLTIIEERVCANVGQYPQLEIISEQLVEWRRVFYECGLCREFIPKDEDISRRRTA